MIGNVDVLRIVNVLGSTSDCELLLELFGPRLRLSITVYLDRQTKIAW